VSFRYKSIDLVLLYVAVPPRWTVEPTDANVASGQDVTLHCQADGYPVPSVTWRKAVGTLSHILQMIMYGSISVACMAMYVNVEALVSYRWLNG